MRTTVWRALLRLIVVVGKVRLVTELWARIEKFSHLKTYFGRWRWKLDMTIMEAMECLDDYCVGLETQLQERETSGGRNISKN